MIAALGPRWRTAGDSRITSPIMPDAFRPQTGRVLLLSALIAFAVPLTGCQQSDERVDLTSARGCLADEGYVQIQSPDLESSLPGLAAPNLAMERDGLKIEAIVNGDTARARRRLADLRGALQALGVADASKRVERTRNAVLVFTPAPGASQRAAAIACFR